MVALLAHLQEAVSGGRASFPWGWGRSGPPSGLFLPQLSFQQMDRGVPFTCLFSEAQVGPVDTKEAARPGAASVLTVTNARDLVSWGSRPSPLPV